MSEIQFSKTDMGPSDDVMRSPILKGKGNRDMGRLMNGWKKYYNGIWVTATVILSVVFAVLFFPYILPTCGFTGSLFLTLLGLLVIWTVYFLRAYIFTSIWPDENRKGEKTRIS